MFNQKGLNQHLRSYKQSSTTDKSGPISERNEDTKASSNTMNTTPSIAPQRSNNMWKNYPFQVFETNVSIVCEQIVYWRKTYFYYHQERQENNLFTKHQN